jgi:hypothetical protein
VVDARDLIVIRARLSDGSRDVKVRAGKGDSVRRIARLIAEESQVSAGSASGGPPFLADNVDQAWLRQENTHCLHGEDTS